MENSEYKISLKKLKLKAYHGVYEEEKKHGNDYYLDVDMWMNFNNIESLSETADYAAVAELIKVEMEKPRELMETLVDELCSIILVQFPMLSAVQIKVMKLNPPIPSKAKYSSVELKKTR